MICLYVSSFEKSLVLFMLLPHCIWKGNNARFNPTDSCNIVTNCFRLRMNNNKQTKKDPDLVINLTSHFPTFMSCEALQKIATIIF